MMMAVFWDGTPCILAEIDIRFKGAYCVHHQGDDALADPLGLYNEHTRDFYLVICSKFVRRFLPRTAKI
jgi:hypothetical protein